MFTIAYTDYSGKFKKLATTDTVEKAWEKADFYASHGTKNIQVMQNLTR